MTQKPEIIENYAIVVVENTRWVYYNNTSNVEHGIDNNS